MILVFDLELLAVADQAIGCRESEYVIRCKGLSPCSKASVVGHGETAVSVLRVPALSP